MASKSLYSIGFDAEIGLECPEKLTCWWDAVPTQQHPALLPPGSSKPLKWLQNRCIQSVSMLNRTNKSVAVDFILDSCFWLITFHFHPVSRQFRLVFLLLS
jgi:hypothetical protein